MNYIKKFSNFIAESRVFAEKPSETHVGQGQKAPTYKSEDPFSRDCSDLLNSLFQKNFSKDEWVEKFQQFNDYWFKDQELETPFGPWTDERDMQDFLGTIESIAVGQDEWTPEEFAKMWDSAINGRVMEATANVGQEKKKSLQFSDLTVGDDVKYDNRPYKVSSIGDDHCFIKSGNISKRVAKIQALTPVKIQSLNEATPNVGEKDAKDKTAKAKIRSKIKTLETDLKNVPKGEKAAKNKIKSKIFDLRKDLLALNEDTPNVGTKSVEKEPVDGSSDLDLNWDKMEHDARVDQLLAVVKDPDEAEKLADKAWTALPPAIVANLTRK